MFLFLQNGGNCFFFFFCFFFSDLFTHLKIFIIIIMIIITPKLKFLEHIRIATFFFLLKKMPNYF